VEQRTSNDLKKKKRKDKMIDWKKESEIINTYADWEVKPTKESVLNYLDVIISINGTEYLFENEKDLIKRAKLKFI
jgi:hypothetical protein